MIILPRSILFAVAFGCLIFCAKVLGQINGEVNDRLDPYVLDEALHARELVLPDPFLSGSIKPLEDENGVLVSLTLEPTARTGIYLKHVKLLTDHPRQPEVLLPVRAQINRADGVEKPDHRHRPDPAGPKSDEREESEDSCDQVPVGGGTRESFWQRLRNQSRDQEHQTDMAKRMRQGQPEESLAGWLVIQPGRQQPFRD